MTIAWECHACGQVSATGRICCGAYMGRVEGLEGYTLDELVVLVGPAWGYDVSREGIVALAD